MDNICDVAHQVAEKISKFLVLFLLMILVLSGCSSKRNMDSGGYSSNKTASNHQSNEDSTDNTGGSPDQEVTSEAVIPTESPHIFISSEGKTLDTRIHAPRGYNRISSEPGEFTNFIRNMPMKESSSPVLLYNGEKKNKQDHHIAVFDMDIGDKDLQQCADSLMRVYAEYYWSIGDYDKIAFHLTNGFLMEYTKWREGNRIVVEGNDVSWSKTKEFDDSYETFRKYLTMVFAYAGTLSLAQECEAITIDDIKPGDLFLQGGSPGHCALVVDIAIDDTGNRCFLLAQGYMPAQDFHVLKNPLHKEDPWYYEAELTFPLETPSWTFKEGSLVRFADFSLAAAAMISSGSGNNSSGDVKELSSTVSISKRQPIASNSTIPSISNQVYSATEDQASQVTLLAVGDNLIHMEVVKSGKKVDGTYNYDHLYANLAENIAAADIAVINQETILGGDDFAYSGYPNFNSPEEIGDAIVNAGFDVVLHATNHTMDKGLKGIKNTFAFWSGYPEIMVLGINESKDDQNIIPILEKNGIKIAMLNYTYGLNGYNLPDGMPYLVNLLDKNQMETDIKKARELADFVIVFPHWGTEYIYKPSSRQKELKEFYYALGVDLVIGSHPHVLEPVEWIETDPDHRMLIYYSLGNFMSYQKEAPRMLGGMAEITITKDASGTYISDAGITPIVTHYEIGPLDYNYGIFKLTEYTPEQAQYHGVSQLAEQGSLTYEDTYDLANQVLGDWFIDSSYIQNR